MKKYYNAEGKEVKVGDCFTIKARTPFIQSGLTICKATEEMLGMLVEIGLLTVKDEEESKDSIPMDLDFYVGLIADANDWSQSYTTSFLNQIGELYPVALFQILLRAIAEYLDERYPDHIKDSPEIYGITTDSGEIFKLDKRHIKNYHNFAAFRSAEDAGIACRILREMKREMFKKSGK